MALRQLFHEIVAAVFGVPHWLVVLACLVALVLAGFSWSSFRRARQLR
jgi:hypothetical protein